MIVVKVGGNAISQLNDAFYQQMQNWVKAGEKVIVVHGGGQLITAACDFFDLPTTKINGIRVTSEGVMAVTQHVLTNVIQSQFVRLFVKHGVPCFAANQKKSGRFLFVGDYLDKDVYGQVGQVTAIDFDLLNDIPAGQVMLVNSLALGPKGQSLNVNADEAAQALATAVNAKKLILLTDVPGVLVEHHLLDHLGPTDAKQLIAGEQITGGMVPKIESAFSALHHGVQKIVITNQVQEKGTELTL